MPGACPVFAWDGQWLLQQDASPHAPPKATALSLRAAGEGLCPFSRTLFLRVKV